MIKSRLEKFLFNTGEGNGHLPMKQPDHYGLPDYHELSLNYDGVPQDDPDQAKFVVWTRPGDSDKVIVAFHGQSANWGEATYQSDIPHKDPHYRTTLLTELAAQHPDATIHAVSMPGYGKAYDTASFEHCEQAYKACAQYLMDNNIEPQNVSVFGESMGGFHAAAFASEYVKQAGEAVKDITLAAPFFSLSDMAFVQFSWLPELLGKPAIAKLDADMNTFEKLSHLNAEKTRLTLFIPAEDETVPVWQQMKLVRALEPEWGDNMRVFIEKDAHHLTWDKEQVVALGISGKPFDPESMPSLIDISTLAAYTPSAFEETLAGLKEVLLPAPEMVR